MPTKSKPADSAALISEDAIRQRAYFLWEADGRPDGAHDHYWTRAHAEATEAAGNGVAKGKTAKAAPTAVKATKATKEKVKAKVTKAAEPKPAKKAPKPRAAVPKGK